MKTFYTERDIEDLHATGVTEIEINDDIVLTDLAREKAEVLGLRLTSGDKKRDSTERLLKNLGAQLSSPINKDNPSTASSMPLNIVETKLVGRVKAGVIAKLGTTAYNDLLDQVIPQVLAQVVSNFQSSTPPTNEY